MKHRNLIAVALLPFITFGIYSLVWLVKTKGEMNRQGANIPTAWLLIIPVVSIWWTWKYAEGVEQVTGSKMTTVIAFILLMLLGSIGAAIVQDSFNNHVEAVSAGTDPSAPATQSTPPVQPPAAPTA